VFALQVYKSEKVAFSWYSLLNISMDFSLMKSLLECPVCLTIPRDQSIFLCNNSHKICSSCFDLLDMAATCPQGKCEYNRENLMRNRDLEKIIAECDIELSCQYWRKGCDVEDKRKILEKHEADCSFRTVPCPFTCGCRVLFRDLRQHLQDRHRSTHFKGKGESLSISWILKENHFAGKSKVFVNGVWENLEGQRSYCHFEKLPGKWVSWVSVEGGKSVASGLKSVIKIKSKIDEKNIAFEGRVFSIDCLKSDIISSKECLTMTDHQVKNLRNINLQGGVEASGLWGQLAIEFSVKKQEE